MNHYLIFALGFLVGEFAMLCAIGFCFAARENSMPIDGVDADDTYGMTCKHLMEGR